MEKLQKIGGLDIRYFVCGINCETQSPKHIKKRYRRCLNDLQGGLYSTFSWQPLQTVSSKNYST